jgi:hypothetical protein
MDIGLALRRTEVGAGKFLREASEALLQRQANQARRSNPQGRAQSHKCLGMCQHEARKIGDHETLAVRYQGKNSCVVTDRVEKHSTLPIAPGQRLRGWLGQEGIVCHDDQIWMRDTTSLQDGLTSHTGKSGHRGTTTLGAVHGRILDDKPRGKGRGAYNTTRRLHPLTAATVKANT